MTPEIKICGLKDGAMLAAAANAGATMAGFVFYPRSPRSVTLEAAAALATVTPPSLCKVALVVDPDDRQLRDIADALAPDLVQAHGRESPARTAAIEDLLGLPVMKAVAVADGADIARARAYVGHASRILFDAKPPTDIANALPGGNGVHFDWHLLANGAAEVPWMLSGGLESGNVAEAMRISGAPGVDTSSGVETRPGVKDAAKIAAFVAAAAAA